MKERRESNGERKEPRERQRKGADSNMMEGCKKQNRKHRVREEDKEIEGCL